MSAEICSFSETNGNHEGRQSTTAGGSKPLHRFLRGQPKIIGTVVLVLGSSLFIVTVATMSDLHTMYIWSGMPATFVLGAMFIACGILYVVADHNPTKKTVTTSLALSIFSILAVAWTMLCILPHIGHYYRFNFRFEPDYDSNITETEIPISSNTVEDMVTALEAILIIHSFVGAIILIVMSALAGAALRSTRSQAIVVMTTAPTETPTE